MRADMVEGRVFRDRRGIFHRSLVIGTHQRPQTHVPRGLVEVLRQVPEEADEAELCRLCWPRPWRDEPPRLS